MEGEEEQKHIMTVTGPKLANGEGVWLPYEHITSDLSGVFSQKPFSNDLTNHEISLRTLHELRIHP